MRKALCIMLVVAVAFGLQAKEMRRAFTIPAHQANIYGYPWPARFNWTDVIIVGAKGNGEVTLSEYSGGQGDWQPVAYWWSPESHPDAGMKRWYWGDEHGNPHFGEAKAFRDQPNNPQIIGVDGWFVRNDGDNDVVLVFSNSTIFPED